jgi:prepilin-type N-terminal cleavage/methylation domain-containing protein
VRKFRPRAFTLIEIAVAIALALLILALAIPALDGMFAAGRLQRSMEAFDSFVSKARDRSMAQGRVYVLAWDNKRIRMTADGPQREDLDSIIQVFTPGDGESYSLLLPSAIDKDPAPEWTFWPTGTCEPATIQYKGPAGTWELRYSALSARPTIRSFLAK